MSQCTEFNSTGFTPVSNNDPGLGSNNGFTPMPNNDPGLGNTDTNNGFKPVPSNDPGFGNTVSSFSEESFAQAYSKGFSQGFKKAASGEVQKVLELAKPGLSSGGFGSGGFQQNGFVQQQAYQPPKDVGRDDGASAKVVEGVNTAVDVDVL